MRTKSIGSHRVAASGRARGGRRRDRWSTDRSQLKSRAMPRRIIACPAARVGDRRRSARNAASCEGLGRVRVEQEAGDAVLHRVGQAAHAAARSAARRSAGTASGSGRRARTATASGRCRRPAISRCSSRSVKSSWTPIRFGRRRRQLDQRLARSAARRSRGTRTARRASSSWSAPRMRSSPFCVHQAAGHPEQRRPRAAAAARRSAAGPPCSGASRRGGRPRYWAVIWVSVRRVPDRAGRCR